MYKLAINNGKRLRTDLFPRRMLERTDEIRYHFSDLVRDNALSGFRGSWNSSYYGGVWVQDLEKMYEEYFPGSTAISVNSATSGLQIACHAIGLKPGDEVIVTPWSMSCSASAPLVCGATPVFADIEKDYFCLDPKSVKENITDKTKAIIVVDLFGQGYSPKLDELAKKHGLYIIEDAAQAIGSDSPHGKSGARGDIGIFSFTQGKHISAGEGGMILTKDETLADRCQLIRNHAEAVNGDLLQQNKAVAHPELFGYNMRLTEVAAMIAGFQTKGFYEQGLKDIIGRAEKIIKRICDAVPTIKPCKKRFKGDNTHSYYVLPFIYNGEIPRDLFINAVKAELAGEDGRPDKGVPINGGYIMPLCYNPLFKKENRNANIPNTKKLQHNSLFLTTLQLLPLTDGDIEDIGRAFEKVYKYRGELI